MRDQLVAGWLLGQVLLVFHIHRRKTQPTHHFQESTDMNFNRIAVLVGGSLLLGTLGVAQAATPANTVTISNEVPSVTVRYGDLNLATEAGAHKLYQRLSAAAQEVC